MGNKLKLGTFATNLDGGFTATTAEERHRLSWESVRRVAKLADAAGFEMQVPLARWRSLGGVTDFCGVNYEGLAWAAGVSGVTEHSHVYATVHVPVIHPIVAAKQMTTIDHISGGRFGVNVVCGWFPAEFEMFGATFLDHDARYRYAGEWIEIVRKLWTMEEEFDYEGEFFKIIKGQSQPKPLRKPHPPIMQAGQSGTGLKFAAKYADIAFRAINPDETNADVKRHFDELRRMGREEYNRSFDIWTQAWIICKPTEREANEYMDYVLGEKGDIGVLDGLPPNLVPREGPPEVLRKAQYRTLAGFGGGQIVGTPEMVAERLQQISNAGADGVLLCWVNYEDGLRDWVQNVQPLLEQAGLREPVR
ncbi:MAG: LLM class flavin-dependent oxidoreductase [Hyphomonadaceae bacterium]|nr:LLM class flavin-dependent oxidoreductase [Hyphomonadaceae bacterium]